MMIDKEKINEKTNQDSVKSIHYSYIIVTMVAFLVGVIGTLLIKNSSVGENINFSTLGMVNLVFSVGLSAASIVLAITAIILSKKSEQAIIERNDEGIKNQQDISDRTIGVLSKIETSTGVSEKRIEDIAEQIRQIERSKPGPESREDRIRNVLRSSFSPNSERARLANRNRSSVIDRGVKFTEDVMSSLKDIKDINLVKVGSGDFDELGDDMVDGVFSIKDKRYSVSTFYSHGSEKIINFADAETYKQYFMNLANEISRGGFEKTFLVFSKSPDDDVKFKTLFDSAVNILDKKISQKMVLASGSMEEIKKTIIKNIS